MKLLKTGTESGKIFPINRKGFAIANLEEFKEVVSFIEDYIGREGVKKRMESDLQGFANAKLGS